MSFFRTPIDPEVQKELFRRIDGINKDYSGNILQPVENPFENLIVSINSPFLELYIRNILSELTK